MVLVGTVVVPASGTLPCSGQGRVCDMHMPRSVWLSVEPLPCTGRPRRGRPVTGTGQRGVQITQRAAGSRESARGGADQLRGSGSRGAEWGRTTDSRSGQVTAAQVRSGEVRLSAVSRGDEVRCEERSGRVGSGRAAGDTRTQHTEKAEPAVERAVRPAHGASLAARCRPGALQRPTSISSRATNRTRSLHRRRRHP